MNRVDQAGGAAVDKGGAPQEDDVEGRGERLFSLSLFHFIERLLLVVIVAMTLLAVAFERRGYLSPWHNPAGGYSGDVSLP
ncbi:hypothetical protein [Ovoidimarina sediminis]|uniref:hypothetical protein n=1 Tax=Ovoidimarina sediminis TaxID=3079856 RepID=UPI0029094144|nr:hypothetical protein [Rhodophyticola sp. MJ-SS7]MDU8946436.1 hypothetical protein [Rhodophyticola sp. MJ-SS7]